MRHRHTMILWQGHARSQTTTTVFMAYWLLNRIEHNVISFGNGFGTKVVVKSVHLGNLRLIRWRFVVEEKAESQRSFVGFCLGKLRKLADLFVREKLWRK